MIWVVKVFLILIFIPLCGCSRFYYYPSRYLYNSPKALNLKYDDLFFKSLDGKTILNGWRFKSKGEQNKGLVVFFHGNAENISSQFLNLIWLTEYGYELFVFDYRGYGRSQGKPDPSGIVADGVAAVNYAYQNLLDKKSNRRFIVYGQSLGGITSLNAVMNDQLQANIDLLILESTFHSYRGLVFDKFVSHWSTFLLAPLSVIAHNGTSVTSKLKKREFRYPVLVIHGTNDSVVPYENGQELYELIKGKKELWTVKNADHLQVYHKQYRSYRERLKIFLIDLPSK